MHVQLATMRNELIVPKKKSNDDKHATIIDLAMAGDLSSVGRHASDALSPLRLLF